MIGIVIPAHDEEASLHACLQAVRKAAAHPQLQGEAVSIVVVLDSCSDGSEQIARRHPVTVLPLQVRNVGLARHHGARALIAAGARWLAFTDADTRVAPDWLAAQLALQADAVCGTVSPDHWGDHPPEVQQRFARDYHDEDGHRHIHGANLGVCAQAYLRAGGFPPLACHEDVGLVQALQATDAQIAWSARVRVVTSTRKQSKARGGFGDTLRLWAAEECAAILPA
ncbi:MULTISPECIES: glycosyltransferase [unclassified Herbaspirillum]|uniref:glycosyltransferase n=1 Tax=unclassified Herbaspirillum TaxID=2624150 RepID=UPI000C0B74E1|nr:MULTISPECIES: glycosyltransferase [unclassified Herbaspirillum]MAF05443.1 glycosyl transferase [Herbaspirillum sp.]MBO16089.1 glycosyl transferase [Herbaspirillum sp.]|tara:strand:+ start:2275 stop:2952 length:678 start_codon:yes stop_codon:yes gene_type:complete